MPHHLSHQPHRLIHFSQIILLLLSKFLLPAVVLMLALTLFCLHASPGAPMQSVINLPLHERHALLAKAVSPAPPEGVRMGSGLSFAGRILTLTPGAKLPSGVPGCVRGSSPEVIQEMIDEAIRVEVRLRTDRSLMREGVGRLSVSVTASSRQTPSCVWAGVTDDRAGFACVSHFHAEIASSRTCSRHKFKMLPLNISERKITCLDLGAVGRYMATMHPVWVCQSCCNCALIGRDISIESKSEWMSAEEPKSCFALDLRACPNSRCVRARRRASS